tara:strand:+ start:42 stop:317 length:276 start_codon:yes stop_codon:yes gene_type:complete
MKSKCKNPNGLHNLKAIIGGQTMDTLKFNSLDKAKRHLKSEGYRFNKAFNCREDKAMFYQGRYGWVKLTSTFDYLNKTSMEQGTVWNIVKL